MNRPRTPVYRHELPERYAAGIEVHLGGLARGHDPWGHLFAIERLARAARVEWSEARFEPERRVRGR